LTEEGKILINGLNTEFKTIEEARNYIKEDYDTHQLADKITKDTYQEISENTVASIIKEYHDIKVTDTLIESYIELASSKLFTVDPVVLDIRNLNKLDKLIEGKIDYKLADGTIIAINESTQDKLAELFKDEQEIIEHMRESKENFIDVLKQIGE
jgi:hypothetical protein